MAMSLIICWATKEGSTLSWLSTPTQSLRTWCGFDQIWKTKADENYHRQEQLFLSLVLFLSPEPRLQRPGCQLLNIWSNASFTFSSPRRLFSGRAQWGTRGLAWWYLGVLGCVAQAHAGVLGYLCRKLLFKTLLWEPLHCVVSGLF